MNQISTIEARRLSALRDYDVLNGEIDEAFGDVAKLGAEICEAPLALVSFVGEDCVWVKARVGIELSKIPRRGIPCAEVVEQGESMLVIKDLFLDPRFASSPLVTGPPFLRFYAGAPLVNAEGLTLGTICVGDRQPRELTFDQLRRLTRLARLVVRELESRRSVNLLRESKNQLRLLEACVAHTSDMIMITRAEPGETLPRIVFVNDSFVRRMQYSRSELMGRTPDLLRSERSDPAELNRLCQALKTWEPIRLELVNRTKEGEDVWIEMDLSPVADGGKDYTHWISVHREIGERKTTIASLERATQLLDETQQLADVGGWELNLTTRAVYWTSQTYRIFGVSPDRFQPSFQSSLGFYSESSLSMLEAALQKSIVDGSSFDLELEACGGDGRNLWLHLTCKTTFENGRAEKIIGAIQDITAFKANERSLRLLGSAVENSQESILITDAQLDLPGPRIIYVNPAFTKLSGYTSEDVIGKTPRILQGPRSDRSVLARLRRNLSDGEMFRGETVNYRKDRSQYHVEWRIAPIRDEKGAITHFVSVQRDVTDQRKAHEELIKAKESAESANQAKSEFLSRMSHELRTPLHAILGFCQLLQRRGPTAEQNESLEFIAKSGRHLLGLINEVLDLSRIECGGIKFAIESVHLLEALQESRDLVRSQAEQRGITINWEESELRGRLVRADRQRLVQIFVNLLSNAIKYNHANGAVTISGSAGSGDTWGVTIRDTGPGIKPELMERLFVPFERLGAEHTSVEGAGIGLALARRLAILMGGSLEAESRFGEGSSFKVIFPVAPLSAPVSASAAESASPFDTGWGMPTKVLYVEDNPLNVLFMEHVFRERSGVEMITTTLGQEAVGLARLHLPNLILLDYHLPDINGGEVLRQLQSDDAVKSIPVVILSADALNRRARGLLEQGASDYLTKPLEVEKVMELVSRYLTPAGACKP